MSLALFYAKPFNHIESVLKKCFFNVASILSMHIFIVVLILHRLRMVLVIMVLYKNCINIAVIILDKENNNCLTVSDLIAEVMRSPQILHHAFCYGNTMAKYRGIIVPRSHAAFLSYLFAATRPQILDQSIFLTVCS